MYPNGDAGGSGADVARRLSKRQLEKSPEHPVTGSAEPGQAPVESKFAEAL